jgi:selenocysteine lyase/cysteine desulfurase
MVQVLDGIMTHGPLIFDKLEELQAAARASAATLVHAKPHQIAFLRNTSDAISAIANGIRWQRGDNIVSSAAEFPANAYPWKRVAGIYGVEMRVTNPEGRGLVDMEQLLAQVDDRTRVVTVSWVQFASGQRLDIRQIGKFCRDRNILFVVDAIQGLGALQLDVEKDYVDALAAGANKFLLGTKGVSLLYLSERAVELVQPAVVGWTAVKDYSDYVAHATMDFREGAARFEGGALNVVGICGLGAAIDLFLRAGPENIERHLFALAAYLTQELKQRGYQVIEPQDSSLVSSIVVCKHDRYSPDRICNHLASRNIITSARHEGLRISPHFYNSHADLDALLASLPS